VSDTGSLRCGATDLITGRGGNLIVDDQPDAAPLSAGAPRRAGGRALLALSEHEGMDLRAKVDRDGLGRIRSHRLGEEVTDDVRRRPVRAGHGRTSCATSHLESHRRSGLSGDVTTICALGPRETVPSALDPDDRGLD
jgi:hypothetical protein